MLTVYIIHIILELRLDKEMNSVLCCWAYEQTMEMSK